MAIPLNIQRILQEQGISLNLLDEIAAKAQGMDAVLREAGNDRAAAGRPSDRQEALNQQRQQQRAERGVVVEDGRVRGRNAAINSDEQLQASIRLLDDLIKTDEKNLKEILGKPGVDQREVRKLQSKIEGQKAHLRELQRYNPTRRDIGELRDAKGVFVDSPRRDLDMRAGPAGDRNQSELQVDVQQSERRAPLPAFGAPGRPDLRTADGVAEYIAMELDRNPELDGDYLLKRVGRMVDAGEFDPVGERALNQNAGAVLNRDAKKPAQARVGAKSPNQGHIGELVKGPDGENYWERANRTPAELEERAAARGFDTEGNPVRSPAWQPAQADQFKGAQRFRIDPDRRVPFDQTPRGRELAARELQNTQMESPLQLLIQKLEDPNDPLNIDSVIDLDDDFNGKRSVRVADLLNDLAENSPNAFDADGTPLMQGQPLQKRAQEQEAAAAFENARRRENLDFTPEEIALAQRRGLEPQQSQTSRIRSIQGNEDDIAQRLIRLNLAGAEGFEGTASGSGAFGNRRVNFNNPEGLGQARQNANLQEQFGPAAAPVQGPRLGPDVMGRNPNRDIIAQEAGLRSRMKQAGEMADELRGQQGAFAAERGRRARANRRGRNDITINPNMDANAVAMNILNGRPANYGLQFFGAPPSGLGLIGDGGIRDVPMTADKRASIGAALGRMENEISQLRASGGNPDRVMQLQQEIDKGKALIAGPKAAFPLPSYIQPDGMGLSAAEFSMLSESDKAVLLEGRNPAAGWKRKNIEEIGQLGKALGNYPIDLGNVNIRADQAPEAIRGFGRSPAAFPDVVEGYIDGAGNLIGDVNLDPRRPIGPMPISDEAAKWVMGKMENPYAGGVMKGAKQFFEEVDQNVPAAAVKTPADVNVALENLNRRFAQQGVVLPNGIRNIVDLDNAVRQVAAAGRPVMDTNNQRRQKNFGEVMDELGFRGDGETRNIAQALFQNELAMRDSNVVGQQFPVASDVRRPLVNNEADVEYLMRAKTMQPDGSFLADVRLSDGPWVARPPAIRFDAAEQMDGGNWDPQIGDVGRAAVPAGKAADRKKRVAAFKAAQNLEPDIRVEGQPIRPRAQLPTAQQEAIIRAIGKPEQVDAAFRKLDPIRRIEAEIGRLEADPERNGARLLDLREQLSGFQGDEAWIAGQAQNNLAGVAPGGVAGPQDPNFARAPGNQPIGPMDPNDPRMQILRGVENKGAARIRLEGEQQPGAFNINREMIKEAELRGFAQQVAPVQNQVFRDGNGNVMLGNNQQMELFGAPAPRNDLNAPVRPVIDPAVPFRRDNLGVPFVNQFDTPLPDGNPVLGRGLVVADPVGDQLELELLKMGGGVERIPGRGRGDFRGIGARGEAGFDGARAIAAGRMQGAPNFVAPSIQSGPAVGPADNFEYTTPAQTVRMFDTAQAASNADNRVDVIQPSVTPSDEMGKRNQQKRADTEKKIASMAGSDKPNRIAQRRAQNASQFDREMMNKQLGRRAGRERLRNRAGIGAAILGAGAGLGAMISGERDKREEEKEAAIYR